MTRLIQSRRKRNQRGNAMVEFALGAGILVLVFTGVFEFGYAFYVYNNLVAAVDNGARYAAYRTYDSDNTTPSSAFSTAVKNMVVYGQPSTGTKSVAPGLTASNVVLTPIFTNNVPSGMKVSLSGYSLNALFKTFTLNKPVVTYPFLGVYAPPP
jgi:Flp pilus assembly protein TadG